MAARQSAINTVTMTGSLRRLQELAASLHAQAGSRSRETKEAHGAAGTAPEFRNGRKFDY